MTGDNELRRKALMDAMGGGAQTMSMSPPAAGFAAPSGNTGIGGGLETKIDRMPQASSPKQPLGGSGMALSPQDQADFMKQVETGNGMKAFRDMAQGKLMYNPDGSTQIVGPNTDWGAPVVSGRGENAQMGMIPQGGAPAVPRPPSIPGEPGGLPGDQQGAIAGGGPFMPNAPTGASIGAADGGGAPKYGQVAGFDTNKLSDPNTGKAAGSKYTPDARVFSQGIGAGVPVERGNLGPMDDFYKTHGFPNATVVGDDKIDPDGPGPQSPIDVIRSDGLPVYQNTTGNDQWEAQYGNGGGAGAAGGGAHGGGAALGGGPSFDPNVLSGDPLAKIQQLLAQMSGSRPNYDALLAQLGGGQ